ncbi:MAG: GTPase [Xenococcaceae cyanobacterium]
MSYSSTVAQEQLDYGFLLLTHIVCADRQIHSEESKYLRELGDRANISQRTKNEMEKILAQDNQHLTVDYITKQIPVGQQSEVMRQILAIAYADGYFAPLEREMVDHIAIIWNWSTTEVDRIIIEAERSSDTNNNNQSDRTELSFTARLLKNAKKSPISLALISMVTKFAPETVGRKIEKLEREILLSGPEYDEAIQQCAKIAQEDYQYAELAFNKTEGTLKTLILSLEEVISKIENKNSKATTAKEVAKQLEDSKKFLDSQIIKELAKVRESHQAKQRALNQFSIAFMGRTKAGKSTLHSIITQDGWESIGVGKQRTTRFNRIYEWKNIRIIDTPGIGAADAGGRKDEEIAESMIDEADVICYVVTNDSIQETEFRFLKLLKEKAKPLIILLNIKYNLRDSRRLEHFLKNPDKLFSLDGKSGIGGHIDRIRRYANKYYSNDYFPIVPVMLLAAQLSSEPEHQENKEKLFKASRMQDFLDSIRESLIKYGTIRRSQTFLGSTVGSIEEPNQWINKQSETYHKLSDTLKSTRQDIQSKINKAQKDSCESLESQIEAIFQDVIYSIPKFAENNWKANEYELNQAWKEHIKDIGIEKRLQLSNEEAVQKFQKAIEEILEEVGKELQLISQLNLSEFKLNSLDTFSWKNLIKIGGGILALAGAFLALASPIGIPLGLIGLGVSLVANLFTSKKEKRRKAVAKISSSLRSQIEKQKQTIIEEATKDFDKYCLGIHKSINSYFDELTEGLDSISTHLEKAEKSLANTVNYLNSGYAKRIIDWATEKNETLTVNNVERTIAKVQRNFGKSINIKTHSQIEDKKTLEELKQVLQEDISIISQPENKLYS